MSARDPLSCALLLSSYLFNNIFMDKTYHQARLAPSYTMALLIALSLSACKAGQRQTHQLSLQQQSSLHRQEATQSQIDSLMRLRRTHNELLEEEAWAIYSDTLSPEALTLISPHLMPSNTTGNQTIRYIFRKRHLTTSSEALKEQSTQNSQTHSTSTTDSTAVYLHSQHQRSTPPPSKRLGWRTWLIMVLGLGLMAIGWRLGRWVRFRYLCPR